MKNEPNLISKIIENHFKDENFIYNVYRITKNKSTNF